MRIVHADDDDAWLAASAIYRLGSIVASHRILASGTPSVLHFDLDRQYEQLVECVELRIKSIRVSDLSRYLWGASTLRGIEEHQANVAFNEFMRRLELNGEDDNYTISVEEAAGITWAVGCVKDNFGWSSAPLVSLLCDYLDEGDALSTLSSKMIVRVLWSLALHNSNDIELCLHGLSAIDSRGLQNVSGTSAINLLWSVAQFKDIIDADLMLRLLDRVLAVIQDKEAVLGVAEIALACDAFVTLHETVRLASTVALSLPAGVGRSGPSQKLDKLKSASDLIEKCTGCVVESFAHNHRTSKVMSISALISIFRAAVVASVTTSDVWGLALIRLEEAFNSNVSITMMEATSILMIITAIPKSVDSSQHSNDEKEHTGVKIPETNTTLPPVDPVESEDIRLLKGPQGSRNPRWHGVVGRLAAISATNAAQIKDKACLINASWALATLGYPYRKLLTAVRKRIQFALHELTPNMLARLVVAVAAEECFVGSYVNAGAAGLRASPKLDREFVDQVALSVYHNLAGMTPVTVQIDAMVAVALLGRLTSFEMRSSPIKASKTHTNIPDHNKDEQRDGHRSVTISVKHLKLLPTNVLIKVFWAMHRLPEGIVAVETMRAVQLEISMRNLSVSNAISKSGDVTVTHAQREKGRQGEGGEEEEVTRDDLKLFARALSESKSLGGQSSKADDTVNSACAALLRELQAHTHTESAVMVEEDMLSLKRNLSRSQVTAEAASLCDVLQTFIELNWHNDSALLYLQERNLILFNKLNSFLLSSTPFDDKLCACAYHVGRLDQLLKISKNHLTSKDSRGRYDFGKQLSRWLGLH
jgi:hypothetical protein